MTDDPTTAGPLGEVGARLRALVARLEERFRDEARDLFLDAASWREVADRTSGHAASSLMRDALANEKKAAELEKQADECRAELDALLSAPVVAHVSSNSAAGNQWGSAPVVSGWQPIETAPKDGPVLMTDGDIYWLAPHPHMSRSRGKAMYWMPLPAPPVVTQEGEEPCP